MKKLNVKLSVDVNARPSKTWEIIGPNFVNISDWGRGILKSYENDSAPKKFEDAPAGGRYCEVKGFGTLEEKIIHYDADQMEITWSAYTPKLPGFVKNLQNELKVEKTKEDLSKVTLNLSADLSGIRGFLLGSILQKQFTKQMQAFLKDWKTYAETGQVSEAKKRELGTMAK